jgi:hypothetical protein
MSTNGFDLGRFQAFNSRIEATAPRASVYHPSGSGRFGRAGLAAPVAPADGNRASRRDPRRSGPGGDECSRCRSGGDPDGRGERPACSHARADAPACPAGGSLCHQALQRALEGRWAWVLPGRRGSFCAAGGGLLCGQRRRGRSEAAAQLVHPGFGPRGRNAAGEIGRLLARGSPEGAGPGFPGVDQTGGHGCRVACTARPIECRAARGDRSSSLGRGADH